MQLIETDDLVTLQPSRPAEACVIWLHGLGADGYDFVPIVEALDLPGHVPLQFFFPHAPVRPISLNGGMEMRGWYDIIGIGQAYPEDEAGLMQARDKLHEMIDQLQQNGIPSSRILLAGFSQGGALALFAGSSLQQPLAGILALSAYLPLAEQFTDYFHEQQRSTPYMLMHGQQDEIVPLELGKLSLDKLKQHRLEPGWQTYNMGHTVAQEQLGDIHDFILETVFK